MDTTPRPRRPPALQPHKLERVLALIEDRLAEPIQVRELAAAVHMSPFHFARMFKASTGRPPHDYITLQRMERAKRLLAATDAPLVQVATLAGYQTQAHFTGVFHRRVGVTPRVYRLGTRVPPPASPPPMRAPQPELRPVSAAAARST